MDPSQELKFMCAPIAATKERVIGINSSYPENQGFKVKVAH